MARKLSKARLQGKARRDRRSDRNRDVDSRVLDDEERLNEFRKSFYQSVLPDLPKIRGYHTIWLTTTNPSDSIPARMRLGYEPIRASDIEGWESTSIKTGEYSGCIGVNEMVAFKLPLHLYQMYMAEAHHEQPRLEEEKLSAALDVIEEQMAQAARRGRKGIRVTREEGSEEIVQDRPVPLFARATGER